MAKAVDIARRNLQNLTNNQVKTRNKRSIKSAKEHLLQLDKEISFPKIGLLVDRVDIKNITLKIGLWSTSRYKKQLLISAVFLAAEYFFIKKKCQ